MDESKLVRMLRTLEPEFGGGLSVRAWAGDRMVR